ncbi:MAG: hypothetical protein A2V70_03295 [Planctomycetes bacterium RBG_13_63_9]|nr:MAG: hypothetical protein A2V70_03295 [Planctomycetes bacterium RBG_13_63_9]
MEQADQQPIPDRRRQDNWAAVVVVKLTALVLLSLGLVCFLGYGWLFASVLVGWYLFWPR